MKNFMPVIILSILFTTSVYADIDRKAFLKESQQLQNATANDIKTKATTLVDIYSQKTNWKTFSAIKFYTTRTLMFAGSIWGAVDPNVTATSATVIGVFGEFSFDLTEQYTNDKACLKEWSSIMHKADIMGNNNSTQDQEELDVLRANSITLLDKCPGV